MKRQPIGIIYLAYGKNALREFALSAKSCKKHNPKIPITLFTSSDSRPNTPYVDQCITLERVSEGYPAIEKVMAATQSPYEKSLFVDVDTKVNGSLQSFFENLEESDFIICNEPSESPPFKMPNYFNAGVFAFRKSKEWHAFSKRWLQETIDAPAYRMSGQWVDGEFQDHEQGILNELIWKKNVHIEIGLKIDVFDNAIYNARGIMFNWLRKNDNWKKVVIAHCHSLHDSRLEHFRKTTHFFLRRMLKSSQAE